MAQIVEAASNARSLACALPSHFPAVHRLCGNNLIGAQLSVVSSDSVLLVRKNVVLRLCLWKKAAPMGQDGNCAWI